MDNLQLIAVDLDGTLCELGFSSAKGEENMLLAPIKAAIQKVNRMYSQGHHIVIYTARPREFYQLTEAWLVMHGVRYGALRMGKLKADWYIDDKAISAEDFLKGNTL